MTVKDIGLLVVILEKAKDYALDLKNKGFIIPYELNTRRTIYGPSVMEALVGRRDGKMPLLYAYPAITQIIAELQTDEARERNRNLGILQEEVGELLI